MEIEIVSPRKLLAGLMMIGLVVGGVWGAMVHVSKSRVAVAQALPSPTPTPLPTAAVFEPTATPTAVPTATPTPTAVPDNLQTYLERCRKGGPAAFAPDYAGAEVAASCNHGGENHPQAVVVHATEGELAAALAHLRDPQSQVSAHYVVDRDGTVYQLVPERAVAYHVACGVEGCVKSCPAFLCGDRKPESRSIGIELVNRGKVPQDWQGAVYEDYGMAFGWRWWEEYPQAQRDVLKRLVEDIAARWGFPVDAEHVVGHYRVQGKSDPGPALNLFWERNGNPPERAVWGR
jgi:N-acetylmuramoyl-L-alanine amidase